MYIVDVDLASGIYHFKFIKISNMHINKQGKRQRQIAREREREAVKKNERNNITSIYTWIGLQCNCKINANDCLISYGIASHVQQI